MTILQIVGLAAIWGVGLPAAIYATARLMRILDRHFPMPDGE